MYEGVCLIPCIPGVRWVCQMPQVSYTDLEIYGLHPISLYYVCNVFILTYVMTQKEDILMETIQVRIKEQTENQIDRLQKRTSAPSRSDAIRRAIELSDVITGEVQHGSKIIIEAKDGTQRQVLIPNLEADEY